MQATRGVRCRSAGGAVFLAVSDGSVRLGYESTTAREIEFSQWSIPRGQYQYSDDDPESGWFASAGIRRYSDFGGMILTMPHWLLVALFCGLAVGTRVFQRRRRTSMERVEEAEEAR